MKKITSPSNPQIKAVVKLRNRNKRDSLKQYIIEGYREVLRANDAEIEFLDLFICPEYFLGENENFLIKKISKKINVIHCTKDVFKKISYRDRPDGLLAIAKQDQMSFEDLKRKIIKKKNPFLIIAESIEKPGNLGTILRSCDGAGVDACIVCDPVTDIFNPNVVRASIGTLFSKDVVQATSKEVLEFLKDQKIKIIAATPHAKKYYTDTDMKRPIALVVGTEQYGLSDIWMKNADLKVKIPQKGMSDSLNVATATTILLYEALRQR